MQHSSGRATEVTFRKTGAETKAAVARRREQVQRRLEKRNAALETFMQDARRVRSYLVRRSQPNYGHLSFDDLIGYGFD